MSLIVMDLKLNLPMPSVFIITNVVRGYRDRYYIFP